MAQLRCGILPLRIETGRYVGESPDERLCKLCNGPAIEDEKHVLLNCTVITILETIFSIPWSCLLTGTLSVIQRD